MNRSTQPDEIAERFWTPLRAALTLAALLLLATFGVSSCNSSDHSASTNTNANAPKINMTVNGSSAHANGAPNPGVMLPTKAQDASLKTIDGNAFKLSDLKGKVLLIDLWATWCGPCRMEVPELVKLQSEYGPRGFEVVGLDLSPDQDTPKDVEDFIKEFKINYKVAFVERDLAVSLMEGGNIPQSIVVSRDGRMIKRFVGFSPVKTLPLLRQTLDEALQ